MTKEIEVSDLKNIIQDLISFIVVEGKQFVEKEKQDAYVMRYVECFIKAINEAPKKNRKANMFDIMKGIQKDVKTVKNQM